MDSLFDLPAIGNTDIKFTTMPPSIDDVDTSVAATTARPAKRKGNKPSKSDRLVARREKHKNADHIRRNRMKQLFVEMQELASQTGVCDQTNVMQAGVDIIRDLQLQVQQMSRQLISVSGETTTGAAIPVQSARL